MNNMQLEMWKKDLEQGKAISLEMTTSLLEPTLHRGDAVEVRDVPLNQIETGDIVLCMVGGKATLRLVTQCRRMYGVLSLSVGDADGQDRTVTENMVLGKVVKHRRKGQAWSRPSLWSRLRKLFLK